MANLLGGFVKQSHIVGSWPVWYCQAHPPNNCTPPSPFSHANSFGLSAVCTHLGCVVPWNKAENKFMCPCHGSQYNDEGKVVRGPAPLSLALAHLDDADGKIQLRTWTEEDFRTGLKPWWS